MYAVFTVINKQAANYDNKIEELNQEIDKVREELNEFRNEVEYQNLTNYEKLEVTFDNAKDISIAFFENLEKDQCVSLASGHYYYPDDEIHIHTFEYKHDHIDRENKKEDGWEVHGYQQLFQDYDWSPCTFLADDTECSTSDHTGTVKKMYWKKL